MSTPIRFPTQAANADSMQDDAPGPAAKETSRSPVPSPDKRPPSENTDEAKPGKDINAPGFVRDKDAGQP
jgi:hypothetical protein